CFHGRAHAIDGDDPAGIDVGENAGRAQPLPAGCAGGWMIFCPRGRSAAASNGHGTIALERTRFQNAGDGTIGTETGMAAAMTAETAGRARAFAERSSV